MTIFTTIYESVCGSNSNFPEYRSELFGSIGFLTLFASFFICFLFYVFLGRWRMIWFNNVHWTLTIAFSALTGFLLAYLTSKATLRLVDGYLIRFALVNALITAIAFILFSFILKNFSIFSKRTPL